MNKDLTAKTRRRLLGLFGSSVAGGALLAACGGDAPSTPAAGAPSSGGASAKGTVRWQFRGSDEELKASQAYLDSTFGKDKPNIKVTLEPAPDGRDEKLVAAMVGGNAPDVFESWTDNVTQYADRGQVLDIEPLGQARLQGRGPQGLLRMAMA